MLLFSGAYGKRGEGGVFSLFSLWLSGPGLGQTLRVNYAIGGRNNRQARGIFCNRREERVPLGRVF